MKRICAIGGIAILAAGVLSARAPSMKEVERQFRQLPPEARRLSGPLFWLHGDDNESAERLELYLDKVVEGGNGCFTAESRPHSDWLGPRWYHDLDFCLKKAKERDLKMWIFDEDWWPSQTVGGKVPARYAAKKLAGKALRVEAGGQYEGTLNSFSNFIAVVAGRLDAEGAVEADTLRDLTARARKGRLRWSPPADGKEWQVMTFFWTPAPRLKQGNRLAVDGMSSDCVEWYLQTVYHPHHARFGKDFGKTIPGYFYDEPETPGDWGTELDATFKARGVDWMPCYVAWLFRLSGAAQTAAKYQYAEARAETWGRVMFGGITEWCRRRGVCSIGHFMEHGLLYVHNDYCAGDMMLLQKYSSMGGIDAVYDQFVMGKRTGRDAPCWETPKIASSISHVYGKEDDLAMCEIFGARGQDLTYPEMKWWTDRMQVCGVNFLIPHSFNPRAPNDSDCPPYFYNGGFEPRWPLYRVWADYTSRLSLLLTGGRHVCPVAVLFSGNTRLVSKAVTPEELTSALQDALYDCDWMPFAVFESEAKLVGREIALHDERYRVLVVPAAEVITYPALKKARDFLNGGGTVVGYGLLPSRSGTIGRGDADIVALSEAIWGTPRGAGTAVCKKTEKGGRSYFLPEKPTAGEFAAVLHGDAGVPPVLEVAQGETGGWLHVLHRVKEKRDVFFICNQIHGGEARRFSLRLAAEGEPECWDAMRNELTSLPVTRLSQNQVEVDLTLEPSESVLLVFQKEKRALQPRREAGSNPVRAPLRVVRDPTPPVLLIPGSPKAAAMTAVTDTKKVTASPVVCDPFVGRFELPADVKPEQVRVLVEMEGLAPEEAARVTVNGHYAGGFIGRPCRLEVTRQLKSGANTLRIEPFAPKDVRLTVWSNSR